MKYTIILMLLPALLWAQEFQFQLETDTIPVEMEGWNPHVPWAGGESESSPGFCDIDADGDLDFFLGNFLGTISYFENEGAPFNPDFSLISWNYAGVDLYGYPYSGRSDPTFADIDADGDFDLFTGDGMGLIHYWENIGTAQFPEWQFVTDTLAGIDADGFSKLDFKDIDADGDPDIVLGDYFGQLWLYRNTGSPTLFNFSTTPTWISSIDVGQNASPALADLDADDDYDLLAGTSDIPGPPGLHYYQNRGSSQNPEFVLTSTNLVPGAFTQGSVILRPWTGDIDSDGDEDLFVNANDGLYFFLNVGTPTNFQFQYVTDNWQGLNAILPINGCFWDVDEDLDLDLFISVTSGDPWANDLRFYRNTGTPQNAQMVMDVEDLFPELMIWQAAPFLIDMDQDGDGDGDILILLLYDGGIYFFRNVTGDPPAVPPVQRHPQAGFHLSLGPNPANPVTIISFSLPYPQEATLAVYNLLGARVTTLTSGLQPPGEQSFLWDASRKASGVYIIRLEAAGEFQAGKLIVLE